MSDNELNIISPSNNSINLITGDATNVTLFNIDSNIVNVNGDESVVTVVNAEESTLLTVQSSEVATVEVLTAGPRGPKGEDGNQVNIGGFDKYIQFNSGSDFAGSPNLIFDYITNRLIITGSIIASNITASLFGTASWAHTSSQSITSSYALTASYALNAIKNETFPFSGSAVVTGSIILTTSEVNNTIFLIKSTYSNKDLLKIESDGDTTITSDLFIVRNYTTFEPILTVSQSIIQFVTHSTDPTGTTTAGSIWFTPTALYVGLD